MHRVILANLLGACLLSAPAFGLDTGSPKWSFHGYGTLGVVHSDEDRADYLPDLRLTSGPGRSGAWDAEVDSRIGAQLSFHPTPKLTAVVQMVAEHSLDGNFDPQVEWAYLTYDLSPSFSVRAGRIALGASLASDYRKVGFAIPWARPPVEAYRLLPVTHSDGVDVTYSLRRGDVSYRANASWGRHEDDLVESEGWGLYQTLEWRALKLQLSYIDVDLEIPGTANLFEAFRQFGSEGQAVARRYDPDVEPFRIVAAGIAYDPGDWFAMAEWVRMNSQSVFGDSAGWYVSGGRRFGSLTPFVTFARAERLHSDDVDGLTVSAYPPALMPLATGLNAALLELRRFSADQRTWSVGGRWDIADRVALKAQYDLIDVSDGSRGSFTNLEPGFQPGRVDIFSFSLDFLF